MSFFKYKIYIGEELDVNKIILRSSIVQCVFYKKEIVRKMQKENE
jgi:hypothetical protein